MATIFLPCTTGTAASGPGQVFCGAAAELTAAWTVGETAPPPVDDALPVVVLAPVEAVQADNSAAPVRLAAAKARRAAGATGMTGPFEDDRAVGASGGGAGGGERLREQVADERGQPGAGRPPEDVEVGAHDHRPVTEPVA